MKKLLVGLFILLAMVVPAHADIEKEINDLTNEIAKLTEQNKPVVPSSNFTLMAYAANPSNEILGSRYGLLANYKFENNFCINVSHEDGKLTLFGQRIGTIPTNDIGIGFEPKITKNLSVYIGIFYCIPQDVEPHSQMNDDEEGLPAEGFYWYWKDKLGIEKSWPVNTIDYQNGVGGRLGLSYNNTTPTDFLFFKSISYGIYGGLKYLTLDRKLKSYSDDSPGWHYKDSENFNTGQAGLTITGHF